MVSNLSPDSSKVKVYAQILEIAEKVINIKEINSLDMKNDVRTAVENSGINLGVVIYFNVL